MFVKFEICDLWEFQIYNDLRKWGYEVLRGQGIGNFLKFWGAGVKI